MKVYLFLRKEEMSEMVVLGEGEIQGRNYLKVSGESTFRQAFGLFVILHENCT